MEEKTLYIPVDVTVDDQTNSDDVKTIYHVEIPVKFKKISLDGLYKWNNTKMLVSSTPAYWDFASNFEATATTGDASIKVISGLALDQKETEYDANGRKKGHPDFTTTAYIVPSVTVSGQLNDSYKKIIAEQDKAGYPSPDAKADFYEKTQLDHINSVYAITSGGSKSAQYGVVHTTGYVAYSWHTTGNRYNPTAWEAWTNTQGASHYITAVGTTYDHIALDPVAGVDADIMKNSTYTVSGLYAKAAGRNIELAPMSVEFYTTPAPANPTMTIAGENAKLYADKTFELRLADAKYKPTTEGLHKGTYELKDKYGDALDIKCNNSTAFTIEKIKNAEGKDIPVTAMTITSENYNTAKAGATEVWRNGLVIKVTDAGESLKAGKYSITVTLPVVRLTDTTHPSDKKFTFELEILDKIN